MTGQVLDYDRAAAQRIERLYRTPEIIEQRRRVLRLLAPRTGERILDVGCGTGLLAAELATGVGPTGAVTGIDVSDAMLALARARSSNIAPATTVELQRADAAALPFPDASFDAAAATQAYEFVVDIDAALGELHRVLRARGRALILDTDWDTVLWHSTDHARSQRLLSAWKDRLAHPRLPRELSRHLRDAGFHIAHREAWTIFDPDGQPGSYSNQQLDHIAAALAAVDQSATDLEAWVSDLRALARSGNYFFSLNRYLFLVTRPE